MNSNLLEIFKRSRWFLSLLIWGLGASIDSPRILLKIFEIPSIQEIVLKWNVLGIPMFARKGADTSFNFPKEGIIFQSDLLNKNTKEISDILRARFPGNLLGENLEIKQIFEEKAIPSGLRAKKKLMRQSTFEEGKSLYLEIEIEEPRDSTLANSHVWLSVKLGKKKKKVIDHKLQWDTSKQLYLGFPSYLGSGKKGNIYFLTLLFLRN